MLLTILWIVWLAVIVHDLKQINEVAASLNPASGSGTAKTQTQSQSNLEAMKLSAKFWPPLADLYGISLNGHYVTILSPINLEVQVNI